MSKARILIIDDEFHMRLLLKTHLSSLFELDDASNGEEGLNLIEKNNYSLVILDIMMEKMDGWEVCKTIREKGIQVPIIMLTARSDLKEKVQGLNIGADDYVVKPFDPDEIIARINALLRRSEIKKDKTIEDEKDGLIRQGLLTIDSNSREVTINENVVEFTSKEFDLLLLLASRPNWVFTRDMLLNRVWDETKILDVRTVDSHVKHVRDKLKSGGLTENPIKTVWGVGYKFNLTDDGNAQK